MTFCFHSKHFFEFDWPTFQFSERFADTPAMKKEENTTKRYPWLFDSLLFYLTTWNLTDSTAPTKHFLFVPSNNHKAACSTEFAKVLFAGWKQILLACTAAIIGEILTGLKALLPGGGVLPYMGYIGMCRCEGYGFQAVYSRIGCINQSIWV